MKIHGYKHDGKSLASSFYLYIILLSLFMLSSFYDYFNLNFKALAQNIDSSMIGKSHQGFYDEWHNKGQVLVSYDTTDNNREGFSLEINSNKTTFNSSNQDLQSNFINNSNLTLLSNSYAIENSSQVNSFVNYTNSKLDIGLKHPHDWKVVEDIKENEVMLYQSNSIKDLDDPQRSVLIMSVPSHNMSLDEWFRIMMYNYQEESTYVNGSLLKPPVEENAVITEYPSKSMSFENVTKPEIEKVIGTLMINGQNLLYIKVVYPAAGTNTQENDEYLKDVQKIIKSLTLDNVNNTDKTNGELAVTNLLTLNKEPTKGQEETQIAVSDDGKYIYAFWKDYSEERILFTKSIDGGLNFEEPIFLNDEEGGSENFNIGVFGNRIYVIWEDDKGIAYTKSMDNGDSFSGEIRITNNSSDKEPDIALFKEEAYIVWRDDNVPSNILFAKSSDNNNTFETPIGLYSSNHSSSSPIIKTSDNGSIYVSWHDPETNNEVFFTRSTDNGYTFTKPINLFNGRCTDSLDFEASGSNVYVICASKGTATVERDFDMQSILYYRIILFTRSIDGGNTFDVTYSFGSPSRQSQATGIPLIAATKDMVYVAWSGKKFTDWEKSDEISDDGTNVFLRKSHDNGYSFYDTKDLTSDITEGAFVSDIGVTKNNVFILWEEEFSEYINSPSGDTPRDIVLTISKDSESAFDKRVVLNPYRDPSRESKIATEDSGNTIYVIWATGETMPENGNISLAEVSVFPLNNTVIPNNITKTKLGIFTPNNDDIFVDQKKPNQNNDTAISSSSSIHSANDAYESLNETDATVHSDTKLTTFDNELISFSYPIGWEKVEKESSRGTIVELSPDMYGKVEVRAEDLTPTSVNLDQYLKKYNITEYFVNFQSINDLRYSPIQLGIYPAIKIDAIGLERENDNGTGANLVNVVTIAGNTLFDIKYYYRIAEAKEYQIDHLPAIYNLIDSFNISSEALNYSKPINLSNKILTDANTSENESIGSNNTINVKTDNYDENSQEIIKDIVLSNKNNVTTDKSVVNQSAIQKDNTTTVGDIAMPVKTGVTDELKPYINNIVKMSLRYPTNWSISENFANGSIFIFFTFPRDEVITDNYLENFKILIEPANDITLEEYASFTPFLKGRVDGLHIGESHATSIRYLNNSQSYSGDIKGAASNNNIPGYKMVYSYKDIQTNNEIKTLQISTIVDNKAYILAFTSETSQYDYYLPIVGKVIDSFAVFGIEERYNIGIN